LEKSKARIKHAFPHALNYRFKDIVARAKVNNAKISALWETIRRIKVTGTPNDLLPKEQLKRFKAQFKATFPDAPRYKTNAAHEFTVAISCSVTTFHINAMLDKMSDLANKSQSEEALASTNLAMADLIEKLSKLQ